MTTQPRPPPTSVPGPGVPVYRNAARALNSEQLDFLKFAAVLGTIAVFIVGAAIYDYATAKPCHDEHVTECVRAVGGQCFQSRSYVERVCASEVRP